jgi:cytochrome c oxidase cbb3-type subunit III
MVSSMKAALATAWFVAAVCMGQQSTSGVDSKPVQAAQNPQQTSRPAARPAGAARAADPDRTRTALGLGAKPDAEAAKRGAPVYASNCAFCHGPTARGAEGPSLLTSDVVLGDDHGEKIVPFLHQGRPSKGMPAFAQVDDSQLKDVTEFLHLQIENYANRGGYKVANILVGNPDKGKTMFDARCAKCHSMSGDLAHVGSKFKPLDLQRYWIAPDRTTPARAVTATVTGPEGVITGVLTQLDDFHVTVADASGKAQSIVRSPSVKVELKDPLAFHMEMVPTLKDDDIHDMTAYLEKQK